MVLTSFLEKLNKVDGNIYVIEESVDLKDGVYSGTLEHDNINPMTLTVHTGPKLTGDRIETYALSTPSLTPWKREIRIYADVPRAYISYECDGDTVEAEDINNVQAAINMTQKALNEEESRAKDAEKELAGTIQSETDRAIEVEQQLDEKVNEEKRRAEGAEKVLTDNLALESARATRAEKKLTDDLSSEVTRATRAEANLTENLSAEAARATEAEQKLTTDLSSEVTRSKAAEKTLTDNLSAEVTRAKTSEKTLTDNLSAEILRATGAEMVLTDNLASETTRATGAEKTLTSNLNAEVTRAKAAEKANADNITTESNRATAKEAELQGSIQTEAARAQAAEKTLTDHLSAEVTRAKAAEKTNSDNLTAEVTRSKGAEKTLTDNLAAEVTRAKAAEKTNSDSVSAEVTRAKAKEAELQGNITAEVSRATAAENDIRSTISTNKPNWDDKYTKNEVDNKFSALETAIDWKEAVNTFSDLSIAYPHPDDGWTVNVKDTDYTYRWSGTAWIAISANAIPKATQSVDGLLSKEDKAALDDTNAKKHTHSNKSTLDKLTETLLTNWTDAYNKRHEHGNKAVIDKITQTLLDNWTAAYTHIGDAVKHITATERANWNDANSKKHTHSNKAVIDKVTQALLDNWSAAYVHISDAVKHITAAERTNWNAAHTHVSNKSNPHGVTAAQAGAAPASHAHSYLPLAGGTMDENKSVGIKARATGNSAQGMWFYNYDDNRYGGIGSMADEGICNRIFIGFGDSPWDQGSSLYITPQDVYFKQNKVWHAGNGGTGSGLDADLLDGNHATAFAKASHTHMKSQITDMPTKVSQFTNDKGYITAADVDTSQNHVHANKSVLDKITQALLDNWNAAHTHVSDTVKHITGAERTNWNDANGKKHTHGNKSILDGITQALVDKWNSALTALPAHIHTKSQITDFPASLPANGGTANYANYFNVNNIAASTDLNSLTAPGFYYCPANVTAAALKNCPTTNAFFMEVGKHAGTYQWIVEYGTSNPRTFQRNYYSSVWQAWQNITVLTPVPAGAKFTDTVYVHPATAGNKHIPAGGASGQFLKWSADGTAVWAADNNTTYSAFKAATASAAGGAGLVPAPPAGAQAKYLRADGTWQTPPDTKYTHPNSGVVAGTYQNVTVNEQGHVTGGTPQGPFTWNQVHGAYTWDQLKGV